MQDSYSYYDSHKKRALRLFWSLFFLFYLYGAIRYNLLGGVEWFLVTSYTLNKALAWNALTTVALSYAIGGLAKLGMQSAKQYIGISKYMGQWGFVMAMVHAVLSLRVLTPDLFPSIYDSNLEFNMSGNLLILFGILTLSALMMPGLSSLPSVKKNMNEQKFRRFQKLGYLALIFASVHVSVIDFNSWFDILSWNAYMPPITLIAFLTAIIPLLLKLITKLQKKQL